MRINLTLIWLFVFCTRLLHAQFAPPMGQAGTTAMHKDSSAFIAWANGCQVVRGPQDISQPSLGTATVGAPAAATGQADGNNIVSLGDGGYAILQFPAPITNGAGFDFAVFENSFNAGFLELAFVEVSSNGIDYVRFPATCNQNNSSQIGPFDYTCDATKLNNLAGKYVATYGTPFDLQDLQGIAGNQVDLNAIRFVKIIDVVGSIDPLYARKDKNNNSINDPWPTAFSSGGFDLDAVGVIHQQVIGLQENQNTSFKLYPRLINPGEILTIEPKNIGLYDVEAVNIHGKVIATLTHLQGLQNIRLSENLISGVYFIRLKLEKENVSSHKIIIQ
jgi:hypothetical protein